jgi:hypothetical protein
MPVTKIRTKWSSGDLVFTDEADNEIARFDSTNDAFCRKNKLEHHSASDTLTVAESGSVHTNLGASGVVELTLPQTPAAGVYYDFVVMAAQELRPNPGAGGGIYISGAKQADDKFITANDEAESVRLTADGNGDWIASSMVGTWGVES